jgi:hypothetical protein
MTYNDLNRLAFSDVATSIELSPGQRSDIIYRAVRELQQNTHCSRVEIRHTFPSVSAYSASLEPEYIDSGDPNKKFNIDILSVEKIFIVNADATMSEVLPNMPTLIKAREIEQPNDNQFFAFVDVNRDKPFIMTDFDLNGKTMEFWTYFMIPYVKDGNVSGFLANNLADLMISTIATKFQDRLVSGVKFHIYRSLFEREVDEKIKKKQFEVMTMYSNQWYNVDMTFVKQEVNKNYQHQAVYTLKPPYIPMR